MAKIVVIVFDGIIHSVFSDDPRADVNVYEVALGDEARKAKIAPLIAMNTKGLTAVY